MSSKWNDFVSKSAPKNPFSKMQQPTVDTERSEDFEANNNSSSIANSLSRAKDFVLGRQEPEPQGWLSMFNCLPNDKKPIHAMVSFAISAFFLLLCFFLLAEIILMPAKFVMCFTLAIVASLFGLAFLSGPRIYVKKLFIEKNLIASICLIVSTLLSLWFSMIVDWLRLGTYLICLL